MPLINRIEQLNERITLVSFSRGKVNGVPVDGVRTEHFKTWAMVRNQYLSEIATNAGGTLEDSITFVIRYDQPDAILNTWRVECRASNTASSRSIPTPKIKSGQQYYVN